MERWKQRDNLIFTTVHHSLNSRSMKTECSQRWSCAAADATVAALASFPMLLHQTFVFWHPPHHCHHHLHHHSDNNGMVSFLLLLSLLLHSSSFPYSCTNKYSTRWNAAFQRLNIGKESKRLWVNVVMISRVGSGDVMEEGEWPCAICRKGVGNNSILWNVCYKWVHKRWNGIRGRLQNVIGFECAMCRGVQEGRVRHGRPNRVDFQDVSLGVCG